jgi:hypothetical protein
MPAQSCRRWLKPFSDHSSFLILSGLISVGIYNLQGHKAEPVCPGAEFSLIWPSLPSGKAVEIFSAIRMRKKYYHLPGVPGQGMFGRIKSFRRWAHYVLFLFRSCPARRRGCGRSRPDMPCQGRQGRRDQASLP